MRPTTPFVDRRHFRELYREQYAFVWHTLRRFGVSAPHLDDVVQETFLVAYRRRDDFTRGTARSWLYGISRRVASNHRRSSRRMERRRQAVGVERTPWASASEATVALYALDAFLQTLSPADREIFVLSELEGLTGPELSEAVGRNMATLYSRVRTLRQRFIACNDGEPIDTTLARVRSERPRATMQGFAALLPGLDGVGGAGVGSSMTWPAWATTTMGGLGIGTVLGTAAVAGLALASRLHAATPSPAPDPPPTSIAAHSPPTAPPPAAAPDEATPSLAPSAPISAPTPDRPRASTATPEPPSTDAPDELARENALLLHAKQALGRGEPESALRLADEHQKSFPQSVQADLAVALRIEALCALGRGAQARGEAAVLLRARPHSPVATRVERICSTTIMESAGAGHGEQ